MGIPRWVLVVASLVVLGIVLLGLGFLGYRLFFQKQFDSTTWTAFGTWLLVIGTLVAVQWQVWQQRQINSANNVVILHDRFGSRIMQTCRKELSEFLLKKGDLQQKNDDVLVFFETMGLLTRKGVLDKEMVWSEFCWEVVRYYLALTEPKNQIKRLRDEAKDYTLYGDFEWLYNELLKIDCKYRKMKPEVARPNPSEVQGFLQDESTLV